MSLLSFPSLSGKLVNLRELSIDDATAIVSLMNYEIAKNLYEVPYPYRIDDGFKFYKKLAIKVTSYKNNELSKKSFFYFLTLF